MERAARRPPPIADTTRDGPVAASPAANRYGILDCRVSGSTSMVFQRVVFRSARRFLVCSVNETSGDWPMAVMTMSVCSRVSEPSMGTGRRLPLASGSPSSIFKYSRWVTLPSSSPIAFTGAARNTNSTPSCSAASISTSLAGISPRVRRYTI